MCDQKGKKGKPRHSTTVGTQRPQPVEVAGRGWPHAGTAAWRFVCNRHAVPVSTKTLTSVLVQSGDKNRRERPVKRASRTPLISGAGVANCDIRQNRGNFESRRPGPRPSRRTRGAPQTHGDAPAPCRGLHSPPNLHAHATGGGGGGSSVGRPRWRRRTRQWRWREPTSKSKSPAPLSCGTSRTRTWRWARRGSWRWMRQGACSQQRPGR